VWLQAAIAALDDGYALYEGSTSGRDEVLPIKRTSVIGRAFVDRRTVHVENFDALSDEEYPDSLAIRTRYGFRTVLAEPADVDFHFLLRFADDLFDPRGMDAAVLDELDQRQLGRFAADGVESGDDHDARCIDNDIHR
jgi:hypothetical protein